MRKLKLELDSLKVESFDLETSESPAEGTVLGAEFNQDPGTGETCDGGGGGSGWIGCITVYPCVPTNEWTCQITCQGYTCDSWTCRKAVTCHVPNCTIA
ncbi:MAG TPA: hypothetical protein VFQ45_16340 [Longimicrobium sp.]|nr:hypothetical protein [Longimicrobium sp.]